MKHRDRGAAVLSVLLAAACSAGATPRATPQRATSATSTTSATAPSETTTTSATLASAGCVKSPPAAGETVESLRVAGLPRSYRLTMPATGGSGARPHPLIFLFHGSGSTAAVISTYTSVPARAAAKGYVVVTPDALDHNWQVSLPNATTPDLDFVAALYRTVSAGACIDPARVYAAGFSLGSEFAAIVACAPGIPLAAAGLVSADYLLKPCARPVPVIAFHGTADPAVPYQDGGMGLSLPGRKVRGVEKNLGDWAALDGCPPAPAVEVISFVVVRRTWSPCSGQAGQAGRPGQAGQAGQPAVVLYTVIGGGHAWPGPPLDATGRMLDFFAAHHS